MERINSLSNNKIKYLIALRKASRRRKEGVVIIEGQKEILQAIKANVDVVNYYFCKELIINKFKTTLKLFLEKEGELLRYKGIEVSRKVFQKISYKDKPDGVFVLAKRPQLELHQLKLSTRPLVLVLESVEKPGNLGAMLRTADATQVEAVLLCNASTDIYNPNSIRASLGAIFTVPTLTCSNEEALAWLLKNKINIYAAGLEASIDYKQPDYKKSSAIVIGTEHDGLSSFWLQNSKQNIKIPMQGEMDSLNASVSAAVILYEALRERE